MRETKNLTLKTTEDNINVINEAIHSMLPPDCDELLLNQIDLAVEEIFVNIVHYSGAAEADVVCSYDKEGDGGVLEVIFSDNGTPFNPLAKPDPDITLSAEEREIGGLGIFLTKKFMNKVEYEYIEGKNKLKIQKKLPG